MGKKIIKCAIRPKVKSTPITEDAALLQKLLDEQPDILSINRRYTFDGLKDILQKFLNPEEELEIDTIPTTSTTDEDEDGDGDPFLDELKNNSFTLETKTPAKSSNVDKFDSLFNN
jgi:hypothetical protein